MSSYHTQLLNHELGLLHLDQIEIFSAQTCELLADLIMEDPLLTLTLTDMLIGKSDMYTLNNLNLSQLFCNQISKLMVSITNSEIDENGFDDFIWLLSVAKKHLNWKDLSLIQHLKELTVTLLSSNKQSVRDLSASLLDVTNGELLQVVDCAEQHFKLNVEDFDNVDQIIKLAETFSALLVNSTVEDIEKIFLLCYHYKIHILQSVLVSVHFLTFLTNLLQ